MGGAGGRAPAALQQQRQELGNFTGDAAGVGEPWLFAVSQKASSVSLLCLQNKSWGVGINPTRGRGFLQEQPRPPPFQMPSFSFSTPLPDRDTIFPGKCSRGYFWYPTGSHQRPDLSSNHPVKKPPLCFLWRSSQSSA